MIAEQSKIQKQKSERSYNKVYIFYIWRVNWRWYIAALTIALTFIGVSVEQNNVPNQEIVLQFNAHSISAAEAGEAISGITKQLKALGVEDIRVSKIHNGKLKVTYYSAIEVSVIKDFFKNNAVHTFGHNALNEENPSSRIPYSENTYKLDVVKIQNEYGSDIGLNGIAVEVKSLADRYLMNNVSLEMVEVNFKGKQITKKKPIATYYNLLFTPEVNAYKIPEVRAGPLS